MLKKVECYGLDGTTVVKSLNVPKVFSTPIRKDLVHLVFKNQNLNGRTPYAVSKKAGMQHSAESWGTGRALARVARVRGSGTRRAGQGACANSCRGGRRASPTTVNRRWNRKTNLMARRHALSVGIAGSAVTGLVESRGHRVSKLKSLPLVVSNDIYKLRETKDALEMLKEFGLDEDVEKVKENISIRAGKGKMRNRRYIKKKGILIVGGNKKEFFKAFRNICGVECVTLDNLNIKNVCPGGHIGRLILWVEDAFEMLSKVFGEGELSSLRKGYSLMKNVVTDEDLEGIFYSDEVQAILKEPNFIKESKVVRDKNAIMSLNPYLDFFRKEEAKEVGFHDKLTAF
ncbi:ribosomal protein L4 [Hamiltosporidium tvaerminnensis]|uniref:Large ribosomal subunit protein uL4 n=2 Tax=Hamiltosporidium TaxID=1176354 RepID=A0A4Q9LZR5_9MICR|nr:60S ribosomal protein L4 [Hamiltosporidium tvaerminnensis]TBU05251.1 ribosomal protein L4 [Hamiltosporidium tvaerminnensis]TBU05806.1 ribosomal protein L4 [Hamiltosporidium magnivora]TBU10915.1 ribosomal protein L4 [Hamiltosporidium tvaerminnensis]TBU19834.1 ribosomal protein L4 [Hamiltosporidium tvaerminnensis]